MFGHPMVRLDSKVKLAYQLYQSTLDIYMITQPQMDHSGNSLHATYVPVQ